TNFARGDQPRPGGGSQAHACAASPGTDSRRRSEGPLVPRRAGWLIERGSYGAVARHILDRENLSWRGVDRGVPTRRTAQSDRAYRSHATLAGGLRLRRDPRAVRGEPG